MEEKKQWALRKSPTVPQEAVQLSDGRWVGPGNICVYVWRADGTRHLGAADPYDLIPLETAPKKALRCWYKEGAGMRQWRTTAADGFVEMIERAPGDKLAEAVRMCGYYALEQALRDYDEATNE